MILNHPNYTSDDVQEHSSQLNIVNDFYKGIDDASKYLIQYARENTDTFNKRVQMLTLSNFVKKAVTSTSDVIYRKPIDVSELESSQLSLFLDSIDYTHNIQEFARMLTINATRDGFTFLLIDKEAYGEDVLTKADELSKRPYFVNIERLRVRNWKLNERGELTVITYDESYVSESSLYAQILATQQRVFLIDGTVEVWRKIGRANVKVEEYNTGLNYIPIIKIGVDDIPRFYDLAKINANHMNVMSEQRNYARIGAAPIPITYGYETDGKVTTVGVSDGINFSGSKGEAGFEWVELSGRNNEILEKLIDRDEATMRSYLAELISNDTQKTAKEVSISNTENESKLGYYAGITESALNKAFVIMAEYQGIKNFDAKLYINRDYYDKELSSQQVDAYKAMFAEGVISWETLMQMLVDGEILEPMDDQQLETEKARLSNGI